MSGTIVQIVPRRARVPEGVGDYARLIAERLLADHGLRTIFVAGTPLLADERLQDAWETHELPARESQLLLETLERVGGDTPILLHLSAYGYQYRGVPLWLTRAMRQWRRRHPATPLVTVFHELFATGPIWRSAFWVGPFQAHVARQIQRSSTAGIATTEQYAALLQRWRDDRSGPTIALPVFSTVGESSSMMPSIARPRTLAIFASGGEIYRDAQSRIAAFVGDQGIEEIVDLGGRDETPPATIGGAPLRSLGRLPGEPLRLELARAMFGLVSYDADRLAKSTIFAAYAANGAIPVCISTAEGTNDGLVPGENYLRLGHADISAPLSSQDLESVQRNVTEWYRGHSLARTTARLRHMLTADTDAGALPK